MTTNTASSQDHTPVQTEVLVVDDDKHTRDILRLMLISQGFSVEMAENGAEALKRLESRDFGLVITDLFMPEKDGIETIREIHAKRPELKIIAISGGVGGIGRDCLTVTKYLGASATLKKPFDHDTLAETIKTVLTTGK